MPHMKEQRVRWGLAGFGLFLVILVVGAAVHAPPKTPRKPLELSFLSGAAPFDRRSSMRVASAGPVPWYAQLTVHPRAMSMRVDPRAYRLEPGLSAMLAAAMRDLRATDGWTHSVTLVRGVKGPPSPFHRFTRRQSHLRISEEILLYTENVPPHIRKGVRHPRTRTKVLVLIQEPGEQDR